MRLALTLLAALAAGQARAEAPTPAPVAPEEAAALFTRVCLETLPDFTGAPDRLAEAGFHFNRFYRFYELNSPRLISFTIYFDGERNVCRANFHTASSQRGIMRAFRNLGGQGARVEVDLGSDYELTWVAVRVKEMR